MCRLFGLLSTKEITPFPYIFETKYCILEQVKYEKHNDGWGFCNIENEKISLTVKSINSLAEDEEIAKNIIKNIETKQFVFFVRKASNPLNLNKEDLIKAEATQPFYYDDIAFAHNGSILIPNEIKEKIKNFGISPRSSNDSEVYFITFLKFLKETNDVFEAIKKSEELITSTFKEIKSNKQYPFSSLNVIISYKDKLYAYNKYYLKRKISFKDKEREYYKMCFKADQEKIIISSEPIDDDNWEDLGNGKFIEAWIENGKINYKEE